MITRILSSLFLRGSRGNDGFWDYLGKRSANRSRLELEKIRNDGTQKLLPLLGPGATLIEGGADWHREIRTPAALSPAVVFAGVIADPPIPPTPAGHLQSELEPARREEAASEVQQIEGHDKLN